MPKIQIIYVVWLVRSFKNRHRDPNVQLLLKNQTKIAQIRNKLDPVPSTYMA